MKKKVLSLLLVAGMIAGLLTGCSGAVSMDGQTTQTTTAEESSSDVGTGEAVEPKNGKTYRIAYFLPNVGPWYDEKWYASEQEAKELGFEITLFSAGGYSNVDKQVAQVEDAITAGYDGIILHACSSSALLPAVKKALAAGIKVVTTHVPLDENVCPHIWEDPEGAGQDLAILLANEIGGTGKVFMMNGPAGQLEAQKCEEGFKYIMETYFPEIELTEEYVDQELSKAQKVAEDYITANPDVSGVYCFGATTAAGGMVAALKSAGIEAGKVKLVATNAVEDDLHYMDEGWVQWMQPSAHILVGKSSVDTMDKLFKGETVDSVVSMSMVAINAETEKTFCRDGFIWTGATEDTSEMTK